MINPLTIAGFVASIADDAKVAFSFSDIPPELWGALAGGTLGGLGGYGATEDPMNKKRNAALGAVAGATAGAGLARLFKGDSGSDAKKLTSNPGDATIRPTAPEAGKLPAAQVEPVLQQSEATVRQQAQQQAQQQAVQFSAAREKAELLKDQGQVAARTQALLAPRSVPVQPGVRPRNIVLGPGVQDVTRKMFGSTLRKHADLPEVDWGKILGFLSAHPEVPGGIAGAGLGAGLGWSTTDKKTRQRKMLMGALMGGGFGAGAGYMGGQLAGAAGALREGGEAMARAGGESAESADAATMLLNDLRETIRSPATQQAVAQTGAGIGQAAGDILGDARAVLQGYAP